MHVPTRTLTTKLAAGLVAGLMGLGGIAASAAPASAAPSGCSVSGAGNSRSAYCSRGSGEYRIAMFCINRVNGGASGTYRYGPWMRYPSPPSVEWCAWYERVGSAWYQTR
jgi:hypothetical protein